MSADMYSDDVLMAALEHARGDDRTVLVGALGRARGDLGPEALRRFVRPEGGEAGHTRAAALQALGRRVGADETMLYASALTDRSVPVQLAAIQVLAQCGDRRAAREVFGWLQRKLRRKSRSRNWDPEEVPSVIRYADRNGLLAAVAELLVEHLGTLEDDERAWLGQVWPAVASGALSSNGELPAPDRGRLSQPLFEEHLVDVDHEIETMWDGFVREALSRAQRRGARQQNG